MHKYLWVQFDNDQSICSYYIPPTCTITNAVMDIEEETGKKISQASYNREELNS